MFAAQWSLSRPPGVHGNTPTTTTGAELPIRVLEGDLAIEQLSPTLGLISGHRMRHESTKADHIDGRSGVRALAHTTTPPPIPNAWNNVERQMDWWLLYGAIGFAISAWLRSTGTLNLTSRVVVELLLIFLWPLMVPVLIWHGVTVRQSRERVGQTDGRSESSR